MWKNRVKEGPPVGKSVWIGRAWAVCLISDAPPFIPCTDHFHFSEYILQLPCFAVLMLSQFIRMLFLTFYLLKLYSSTISLCMSPLELILRFNLGCCHLCMCLSFTPHCVSWSEIVLLFGLYQATCRSWSIHICTINGMELSVMRAISSKMVLKVEVWAHGSLWVP